VILSIYRKEISEVIKMLGKVKEYYEKEYKEMETILQMETRYEWVKPTELVYASIQRCLGVAQFAQTVGVKYEELDCYDEVKEKLEKLLKETLEKDKTRKKYWGR
jgi:hypothetical protein